MMGAFYCHHCDRTLDSHDYEPEVDPLDPENLWCIECQAGSRVCIDSPNGFCDFVLNTDYEGSDDPGPWHPITETVCRHCGEPE